MAPDATKFSALGAHSTRMGRLRDSRHPSRWQGFRKGMGPRAHVHPMGRSIVGTFLGVVPLAALAGAGCGSQDSTATVGYLDGGSNFQVSGSDASGPNGLDAEIEQNQVAVTFVAVACAGDCADVQAVASGGTPPYSFLWDNGSTSAVRRVCPTPDASYDVRVTDTAGTGEFNQNAQTVTVPLGSRVPACPDGAASDAGSAIDGAAGTPLGTVTVPGTADLWLAGQPSGSMLTYENQSDVVPADSPVEVNVASGSKLTILATGGTSFTGGLCTATSPDGGCVVTVDNPATNGISGITVLQDALIGVFVGPDAPGGTPPASLDFSTNTSFATLSPLLDQAFFIGDGLTGTGSGAVQQFVVPAGATRLFLADADDVGSNDNNTGQFTVTVSVLP
jgi:hypothetical protein